MLKKVFDEDGKVRNPYTLTTDDDGKPKREAIDTRAPEARRASTKHTRARATLGLLRASASKATATSGAPQASTTSRASRAACIA